MEVEVIRSDYYKNVMKEYKTLSSVNKSQKEFMTEQWVNIMIERIISAEAIAIREGEQSLHANVQATLRSYTVERNATSMSLLVKGDKNKTIIPLEMSYNTIQQAHLETSHGNAKDMQDWLDSNDYMVHKMCSEVYARMCSKCNAPKYDEHNLDEQNRAIEMITINDVDVPKHIEKPSTYTVVKQTDVFTNLFGKEEPYQCICSIDILNLSENPDLLYKYLLIYQDRKTRFIQLRPMTSVLETEISVELIKIIMDFNCPECMVVHADNNLIFQSICEKIKVLTDCEIALALHNSENKLIKIVANNIVQWMEAEDCQSWGTGCHIVQWLINNVDDSYGETPYSKMFGSRYTGNEYKSKFILSSNETLDEDIIFDSDDEVERKSKSSKNKKQRLKYITA